MKKKVIKGWIHRDLTFRPIFWQTIDDYTSDVLILGSNILRRKKDAYENNAKRITITVEIEE
ncbi:hypothetical protein LCGC14_1862970 [marine sediment metagenome]|uniref:Uncharacterized protein n=1 Tax=marine sediment metagenome TaxID=412755 RepID=A0A0F9ILE0_9ZZZZ